MAIKHIAVAAAAVFQILVSNLCLAGEDRFFWFKEEIECDGYKIKVRSNCASEEASYSHVNGYCPQQEILISHPDGKTYKQSLTMRHYWKDKLTAGKIACQKNASGTLYLLVGFDNGGNCDFCEATDLMDDKGKWLTRRGNRLGTVAKRLGLNLNPWPSDSFKYFTNKTRDERQ